MARPNADEFELSETGITHKPSGHRLTFIPGGPGKGYFVRGHETRVLEFDEEAVKRMARRLWAKQSITAKQQQSPA